MNHQTPPRIPTVSVDVVITDDCGCHVKDCEATFAPGDLIYGVSMIDRRSCWLMTCKRHADEQLTRNQQDIRAWLTERDAHQAHQDVLTAQAHEERA